MKVNEFLSHEIPVTQVQVQSELDAKIVVKRQGLYATLETGPLHQLVSFENVCACLFDQLHPLSKPYFGKPLCVCGVGNQTVPHDALGPETARRCQPRAYESFSQQSNFDRVAVICPSVSALTNLSTETIIGSVATAMGAACILTIDASACKDPERLCSTIQLSNSGMQTCLGAVDLCQATLKIPVVSITVPTAIPAADLSVKEIIDPGLFFTPLHIRDSINAASFIIACAVAQVAYPDLDYESCKMYVHKSVSARYSLRYLLSTNILIIFCISLAMNLEKT